MNGRLASLSLLTALLAAAAAMQTQSAAPLYEIRGTVVDNVDHRPIPRALVRLTPLNEQGQLTSLAGEDGRFQFSNIPKGKYRLTAQRRGQRAQMFNETGQYSSAIVVGPGLDATNIVFPLHTLASVTGVVLDQDGDPVPGAVIYLFRQLVLEGEARTVEMSQNNTNSQGQFRFSELAAGRYYLAVQGHVWYASGIFPQPTLNRAETDIVFPLTYYGDTNDPQTASPLILEEGVTAQAQITLHSVPNIHVPLSLNRPGSPDFWAPQLFLRGPGGVPIPANAMQMTSEVNGRQTAELTEIAAGTYLVRTQRGQEEAIHEIQLADGVPLNLNDRPARVSISGQVTFENGQTPPGSLQLLFTSEDDQNRFVVPLQQDGSFTVPEASATSGSFTIDVVGAEFVIKTLAAKGARVVADHLEVPQAATARLSLVLEPSGSLSQLNGLVLRDNQPVAGCMVLLVPSDLTRRRLFRRDQSDSDGSFTMQAIFPGKYTLVALDDQGRGLIYKDPAVIKPYLAAGTPLIFPLRSTDPVRVTVQPRLP